MLRHRTKAGRGSAKVFLAILAACSLIAGCGSTVSENATESGQVTTEKMETAEGTEEQSETGWEDETQDGTEILGRKVTTGETFTDENQVSFIEVTFSDYNISTALPSVLWDPDNFCNMSEEEKGEDGLDLPLTDWTDDDLFCIVVPSTAFFSLTEQEEDTDLAELKTMSDEEFVEKKLAGYDNITALDTVQREETDGGYQTSIKIQIELSLYNRSFTYEGYWISVYHDGKVLDFSYGESRTEDGFSYDTAETVLENFRYEG
ncbi:MAG: hypothetical protein PUD04_02205 [Firmicutes bacterium]|nr:hypothetical protein [Bacillota bacterium]